MPTRIIRPEIITSDTVDKLTWQQEVFYRRLLSVADDYGLYDARVSVMRAALFPLRLDRVSDRDVQGCHDRLVELGMVKVYTVEGRIYGQIAKFGQQYKSEPKFPIPPWANPDEYHPPKAEKKAKTRRSASSRNEPLRTVTIRHLDEDEDGDVDGGESAPARPHGEADGFAEWLDALKPVHPTLARNRSLSSGVLQAAQDAYERRPDADELAPMLAAYYADRLAEDKHGKAFHRPRPLKYFFEDLEDIIADAEVWARETRWHKKAATTRSGAPQRAAAARVAPSLPTRGANAPQIEPQSLTPEQRALLEEMKREAGLNS